MNCVTNIGRDLSIFIDWMSIEQYPFCMVINVFYACIFFLLHSITISYVCMCIYIYRPWRGQSIDYPPPSHTETRKFIRFVTQPVAKRVSFSTVSTIHSEDCKLLFSNYRYDTLKYDTFRLYYLECFELDLTWILASYCQSTGLD